jgi:hypothetical protein
MHKGLLGICPATLGTTARIFAYPLRRFADALWKFLGLRYADADPLLHCGRLYVACSAQIS